MSNTLTQDKNEYVEINGRKIPLHTTINVSVDLLIPNEHNPNEVDEEGMRALEKSIQQNPKWLYARPVVVNTFPKREFKIIAGEHRWRAAKNLGYGKVPVMFVYDSPAEELADLERDNIRQGKPDALKEKALIKELQESRFDIEGLGYTPNEIVSIFSETETIDLNNDPEYNGTTPSKELKCPDCGYIGKKKEFKYTPESKDNEQTT